MDIMSFILVVTIFWLILIFIALPIGVKVPEEVQVGHDPSAPENPMIGKKLISTLLISIVLALIYWYVITKYPHIGQIVIGS